MCLGRFTGLGAQLTLLGAQRGLFPLQLLALTAHVGQACGEFPILHVLLPALHRRLRIAEYAVAVDYAVRTYDQRPRIPPSYGEDSADVLDYKNCLQHRPEGGALRRQRNKVGGTSDNAGQRGHRALFRSKELGRKHGCVCGGRAY